MSGLDDTPTPRAVSIRLALLWVGLAALVVIGLLTALWLRTHWPSQTIQDTITAARHGDRPAWMTGGRSVKYTTPPEEPPTPPPIARDFNAERIATLEADLNQQKLLLRQLAQRPTQTITTPAPAQPPSAPPQRRFQPMQVVSKDLSGQWIEPPHTHTLGAWSWIPCTVETVVNSEIEGYFTVKTKRVVKDVTGRHTLIPQGVSLGVKALTAKLLFGNERIPAFAVSFTLPNGRVVELGNAPITDATGTNGLTGEVNNHVWRLIWTSVFMGGLQGGQQAISQEMMESGATGQVITGIGQEASQASRQRLGRAQDTRPTITVHAGDACNVLVTSPMQLDAWPRS